MLLLLFSSKLCFKLCGARSGKMLSLAQSLLTGIVIALRAMLATTFVANRAVFAGRIGGLGTHPDQVVMPPRPCV